MIARVIEVVMVEVVGYLNRIEADVDVGAGKTNELLTMEIPSICSSGRCVQDVADASDLHLTSNLRKSDASS